MAFFPEVRLGETFGPFASFREHFGFIPNLFRAQSLLPRAIETEAKIAGVVLLKEHALSRRQKESLLLAIAAAKQNTYCVTAHRQMLRGLGVPEWQLDRIATNHRRAGLSRAEVALLDFGLKLSQHPTRVGREDIEGLRRHGLTDEQILEGVLVTALTQFLCTLAVGLGVAPDFEPKRLPSARKAVPRVKPEAPTHPHSPHAHEKPAPYLRAVDLSPETFAPFAFFRQRFGFIPNIFRAQTLRPDVVEAEAHAVGAVLLTDDILPRVQKESILLVISAANLNTYCVAVHCEMLRALGVPVETSDQIAVDHHQAGLSAADTALLDFALKLAQHPADFHREDPDLLRTHGFTEAQILEAVVMTALTTFLNTLQMGLGTVPDFAPKRVFPTPGWLAPEIQVAPGPTPATDPDAALVARVREGDLPAFEELVRRHHRRLYRTLLGITGRPEDAEDSMQEAFMKAFKRIGRFEGKSKFSTWLTRIAINEGLQRLRDRKPLERLDGNGRGEDEAFRPRQVQAWDDNPEQLYSKKQLRELVERALTRLPAKYRLVVMLRDLEGLSTEEAAAVLRLSITALKSRLLRGRLMLREALAPHFVKRGEGRAARA